uniref:Putative secreted protein n=1 Tax=Ixodes ricinus TaxID=34613 RepID=A0A6B0UG95_IXORI
MCQHEMAEARHYFPAGWTLMAVLSRTLLAVSSTRAAAVPYPQRRIAGAFRNPAHAPCGVLAVPTSEHTPALSSARCRADTVKALANVR